MNLSGTMLSNEAMIEVHVWRNLCSMLKNRGIDINEDDDLCNQIKLWGKRYHEYRLNLETK